MPLERRPENNALHFSDLALSALSIPLQGMLVLPGRISKFLLPHTRCVKHLKNEGKKKKKKEGDVEQDTHWSDALPHSFIQYKLTKHVT